MCGCDSRTACADSMGEVITSGKRWSGNVGTVEWVTEGGSIVMEGKGGKHGRGVTWGIWGGGRWTHIYPTGSLSASLVLVYFSLGNPFSRST